MFYKEKIVKLAVTAVTVNFLGCGPQARPDAIAEISSGIEPRFEIIVKDHEPVRYGPEVDDTKPMGCFGDECPITVVVYSEFVSQHSAEIQSTIKKLMEKYRGKIRWIARDFFISHLPRVKEAAIAAHCAGKQDKFWQMYEKLFDNQSNLADEDFRQYATDIELNSNDFNACFSSQDEVALVEKNFDTQHSISGTPTTFINGLRITGLIDHKEFERVVENELESSLNR